MENRLVIRLRELMMILLITQDKLNILMKVIITIHKNYMLLINKLLKDQLKKTNYLIQQL